MITSGGDRQGGPTSSRRNGRGDLEINAVTRDSARKHGASCHGQQILALSWCCPGVDACELSMRAVDAMHSASNYLTIPYTVGANAWVRMKYTMRTVRIDLGFWACNVPQPPSLPTASQQASQPVGHFPPAAPCSLVSVVSVIDGCPEDVALGFVPLISLPRPPASASSSPNATAETEWLREN